MKEKKLRVRMKGKSSEDEGRDQRNGVDFGDMTLPTTCTHTVLCMMLEHFLF